jgi:hypothetical protein
LKEKYSKVQTFPKGNDDFYKTERAPLSADLRNNKN